MRRIVLKTLCVAAVLLFTARAMSYGAVIRVDDDGAGDFATIQEAIDAAVDGDTVLVAPGIYRGDGNRNIDFKGKAITIRSENGPRTCIIDSQSQSGFHFRTNEDANSVLDGLTVTNCGHQGHGTTVNCDRSSPIVRNCVIVGNGCMGINCFRSDVRVDRCVIAGNYEAGVLCTHRNPIFSNCTIVGNWGPGITSGGGSGGTIRLENCIIAENTRVAWSAGSVERTLGVQIDVGLCGHVQGCMDVELVHCCVGDGANPVFVGAWSASWRPDPPIANYIKAKPGFVSLGYWDPNGTPDYAEDDFWIDGDYHLLSQGGRWGRNGESWVQDEVTSPCIDAGDPNSPIGYEPFPNGGVINIGAYGGTAEASKSYFGAPPCEAIIAGDINGDCRVDFADLAILTQHWLAHLPPQVPTDGDGDEEPGRPRGR